MDFSTSALIFLCLLGIGNALECYSCNVTGNDESCKGSLKKCQDPAVCLSATYSSEDVSSRQKQLFTFKSCYLKALGNECDAFITQIKLSNIQAKIEKEKCNTCEENGCNQSHASVKTLPRFLIVVSLFFCISNKVL